MIVKNFVEKDRYYDSVLLMRVAKEVSAQPGLKNISVGMGTPLNKDTLQELGLLVQEGMQASPNDLIIALSADSEAAANDAREAYLKALQQQNRPIGKQRYRSLESMGRFVKDRNLAVISLAGQYAAAQAHKALEMGMDVFMFSDNVPLEQEIDLKHIASRKGLLMMGPDCGLSFINGVAIGLCSKVRRGNIGIAAACGSGMQEVMNIIHKNGGGISHAIGVGGRDLSEQVGGITMLQSLEILHNDPDTAVIVLISKPPARAVAEKIFEKVRQCTKPVVAQFINSDPSLAQKGGAIPSDTFENTARIAMALAQGKSYCPPDEEQYVHTLFQDAQKQAMQMGQSQKYLRGLYCGGSLAEETLTLAQHHLGTIYGNIAFSEETRLKDPFQSFRDCLIDIGAEEFTLGKPHAAIDPSVRIERFIQEARDPETAVILMDFLLGYSLCEDPCGMMAPVIAQEKQLAKKQGRNLCIVCAVCGSDLDPQNLPEQEKKLRNAGAIVLENNGMAARFAALVIRARREMTGHA